MPPVTRPDGVVMIDGALAPVGEARVSVLDRGFLYGDAVFEVMRTYGGVPFRMQAHLERLAASCRRVRIAPPRSSEELATDLGRTLEASGLPEAYLRVVVTRGVGPIGIDLSQATRPSVLIYALPLTAPPSELYEDGVSVGLCEASAGSAATAPGAKTANYLAAVLAVAEVRQRGHHEALFVGPGGLLGEGATSNLFVLLDGELRTPPVEAGILEGITRGVVLELARAQGLSCQQLPISHEQLLGAQEAFITSSVRELVPVVRVGDSPLGDGRPGPVTRALIAGYRSRVAQETAGRVGD